MDIPRVLDLYDRQLRRDFRLKEPGVVVEYAEGITRVVGPGAEPHDNCVLYAHGAPGSADALIAAQVEYFQRLGHAFEWKHHAHACPPAGRGSTPRSPTSRRHHGFQSGDPPRR